MKIPERITTEYLNSLPKIQINPTSDLMCYARYDKEIEMLYMLDSEGNFSGKVAPADGVVKINNADSAKSEDENHTENAEGAEEPKTEESFKDPFAEGFEEDPDQEDLDPDAKIKKKKKRRFLILSIVAAVLLLLAGTVGIRAYKIVKAINLNKKQQEQIVVEPTEAPTEKTPVTEETIPVTETLPVPSANIVRVLATSADLLPGHALTKKDFTIVEIDDIDFRLLSGVNGIYTEADIDGLIGQVMQRYLPAERYISYKDVGDAFEPVNPWLETIEGYEAVTLKFTATTDTLTDFLCGNIASLKIETKTKTTTAAPDPDDDKEEDLPSGMKYSQSVVESMIINTYEIQSVKIIDIYNSKDESLFNQYYIVANIPAGLRANKLKEIYGEEETIEAMIPCSFSILLPSEEAAVLKDLTAEEMSISVMSASANTVTEVQVQTFTAIQEAGKAIASLWSEIQAEG